MTQVDFYVLGGQQINDQWLFACRLSEKAARQGKQILLQVDDAQQAQQLSELLWCHREGAFVPHALSNDNQAPADVDISIGWSTDPGHQHDVLINLSSKLPDFFSRFHRLVEVVVQHDRVLDYTRNHYKFLKDRGYPVTHTDMRLR
ncbi:DNA polymerase III subunit chi [Bacterioplanoides pacificum]|uniref:DNA polymerase III subunit chi n=1 Tax=Bacterioplanoides pacificum TaxID=1171596 RepID=A0ABV7VU37_9GAMM